MSKADEMFRKLGYELKINNEKEIEYMDIDDEDEYIYFNKKEKFVVKSAHIDYFVDMPLLQAINEKVKELRLDRRRR